MKALAIILNGIFLASVVVMMIIDWEGWPMLLICVPPVVSLMALLSVKLSDSSFMLWPVLYLKRKALEERQKIEVLESKQEAENN